MRVCVGPSGRRGLATVTLVWGLVLGVVAATGAGAAGAEPSPRQPGRVLVIGDSIILGTTDGIAANLPGWDVVFDASVSRSTDAGLESLANHGTDFDVVVVALGANDGGSPGVFEPRVRSLLDAASGVDHVVWVTINEARPYYVQANRIIRAAVDDHPNATVGEWPGAIRPGDVGADGLHLTGQGAAHMSTWVAELVRDLMDRPVATTTTTAPATTVAPTTTASPPTTPQATTTTTAGAAAAAPSPTTMPAEGEAADRGSSGWRWVVAGIIVIGAVGAGAVVVASRRDTGRR